ncbi:hypothetical protein DBV15_08260 [Temnothorax longispinosus]|uniref:Uncharacterized protein n=1 Tax=Temnothorax longispinosus TaxID=300112 RepID=A0A4S2KJU7_9HYME|nr:hypothetical protein DBV15_08260 [Temnothorax longispinosus]
MARVVPGQSYLPLKKIETSTDMHNHGARSYQVLRGAMRGDRTEASLCVIRPERQIDQRDARATRTKVNCSPNAPPFPQAFCFEMELRETRDLHENGAETRVTRHIHHARISTYSNPGGAERMRWREGRRDGKGETEKERKSRDGKNEALKRRRRVGLGVGRIIPARSEGAGGKGDARWRVTVINSPPSGGSKETTEREVTTGVGEFVSERQMKLGEKTREERKDRGAGEGGEGELRRRTGDVTPTTTTDPKRRAENIKALARLQVGKRHYISSLKLIVPSASRRAGNFAREALYENPWTDFFPDGELRFPRLCIALPREPRKPSHSTYVTTHSHSVAISRRILFSEDYMSNERSRRRCLLREIYAAITRQVSGKHVDLPDPHVVLPRFLSDVHRGAKNITHFPQGPSSFNITKISIPAVVLTWRFSGPLREHTRSSPKSACPKLIRNVHSADRREVDICGNVNVEQSFPEQEAAGEARQSCPYHQLRDDLSVCNHRVGHQGLLLAYFNAPVERGGYYSCGFAAVRENWRLGESFAMDGADGQVTLRSICHSEGVRNSSVDEGLSAGLKNLLRSRNDARAPTPGVIYVREIGRASEARPISVSAENGAGPRASIKGAVAAERGYSLAHRSLVDGAAGERASICVKPLVDSRIWRDARRRDRIVSAEILLNARAAFSALLFLKLAEPRQRTRSCEEKKATRNNDGRMRRDRFGKVTRLRAHRDTNTGKEMEKISLNWDTLEMTTLNLSTGTGAVCEGTRAPDSSDSARDWTLLEKAISLSSRVVRRNMGTPREGARLYRRRFDDTRGYVFAQRHTEREWESEEKSNYNSLCIVGVIIGARASIMEVQRRLRIGRRQSKDGGGTGRVRWSGKKNEEKDEGGRGGDGKKERERKRKRESPRYSLDDLCGSDAISEASLESGLSPVTSPTRRCDTTINEVKGGTEGLPTELLYARESRAKSRGLLSKKARTFEGPGDSLIYLREWACDPAFGTEVPFHSLSSVCTVRTRGAPAEIQMTMIPSGLGYRIRALSASAIVGGYDECLFSEEGESRAIPGLPREKKRRRRNVFIRAIRCNPQVVGLQQNPTRAVTLGPFPSSRDILLVSHASFCRFVSPLSLSKQGLVAMNMIGLLQHCEIEFREHDSRARGETTPEKIRDAAKVGSYSREAGWKTVVCRGGNFPRKKRACLNVSPKARLRLQFVPSFAQSSLIKEKLKLCRRSYYCLEPSPASLASPRPASSLLTLT